MNSFMQRAIDLALQNVGEGGQPFGAVLVQNDKVIAEGVNELHKKHDVSGHAELLAIRRAQEKYQVNDLAGFTMYASGEPCPMCLAAMCFAGIDKVYYCQSVDDANEVGLGTSSLIYKELKKTKENRKLQMIQMPLNKDANNPMKTWKEKQ